MHAVAKVSSAVVTDALGLDELEDQTVAWKVRVMLAALRDNGWTFDAAWTSVTQRLRVQPNMTPDEADDLIEFKAWLEWSRDWWQHAYDRRPGPMPPLVDGEVFTASEQARLGVRLRAQVQ